MSVRLSSTHRLAHKLLLDHVDRYRWSNWQQRRAHERMRTEGLTTLFAKRPAEAMVPDWPDLHFLYRQVRRRRPTMVFEYGSGCSTLILAKALIENASEGAPGQLLSFESEEVWADVTRADLGGELGEVCEVVFAPIEEVEFAGRQVWRYTNVPDDRTPDLMLLDGPMFVGDRNAAIDPLELEPRLKPGFFLIVDGRGRNCQLLDQHFKRDWKKRWSRIRKATTYELLG